MRISTIYKVINDVDDKVYIGSTTCGLSKRIGDHRYKVRLGNQSKFYNHMREIGVENFKILCIKQYTYRHIQGKIKDKGTNIYKSI